MAKAVGFSFLIGFTNGCLTKLFIKDPLCRAISFGATLFTDGLIFKTPHNCGASLIQAPAFLLGSGVVRSYKKYCKKRTVEYIDKNNNSTTLSSNDQTLVQIDSPITKSSSIPSFNDNSSNSITTFIFNHTTEIIAIVVVGGISIGGYLLFANIIKKLDNHKEIMKKQFEGITDRLNNLEYIPRKLDNMNNNIINELYNMKCNIKEIMNRQIVFGLLGAGSEMDIDVRKTIRNKLIPLVIGNKTIESYIGKLTV